MTDSIYARKGTILIITILTAIVLLGTTIGFIVWVNYDNNYGMGEIVIKKDQDFVNRYDFPGTGSLYDPYVIADYNIETNKEYAIFIEGTTKHFLITNCTINCQKDGIYILKTADGTARIENNKIQGKSLAADYLIHIRITEGVQIINNNLSHSSESVYWYGIYLVESTNSILSNNSCISAELGIFAVESDSLLIEFNYMESCRIGIFLNFYCNYPLIRYNTLFLNSEFGVKLAFARNSIIHHNNFINNGLLSYYDAQASDTEDNQWYDIASSEGNYWSDLVWDDNAEYEIEGYGDSIDLYPLQFPVLI